MHRRINLFAKWRPSTVSDFRKSDGDLCVNDHIVTALAVSDGLTMLAYLPFAMLFYVVYGVSVSVQKRLDRL